MLLYIPWLLFLNRYFHESLELGRISLNEHFSRARVVLAYPSPVWPAESGEVNLSSKNISATDFNSSLSSNKKLQVFICCSDKRREVGNSSMDLEHPTASQVFRAVCLRQYWILDSDPSKHNQPERPESGSGYIPARKARKAAWPRDRLCPR
jgi:hypothetical protein